MSMTRKNRGIAVLSGPQRRRRRSAAQNVTIVAATLAGYMQVVSSSAGPRVRTTATKAVIKVQTTTQCRNEPVGPKAGSGLVLA